MKEHLNRNIPSWIGIIVICIGSIGLVSAHTEYRYLNVHAENTVNATHIAEINQSLTSLKQTLGILENKNNTIATTLEDTESRNGRLLNQFSSITDTVDTLKKLAQADPKLLEKYSKVYFLNENYKPVELKNIDVTYLFNKKTPLQIHANVEKHLVRMLDRSIGDGMNIQVISGYRSFGTQAALKSGYKVTYGTTKANQFSADQGYSEHQLATAVDLTTPTVGSTFVKFEKTPEYEWLLKHAHEYGFVLSYPANNKYYTFEPWHWRFVGKDLARHLFEENKYFYDLDQREINTYLGEMFD